MIEFKNIFKKYKNTNAPYCFYNRSFGMFSKS